MTLEKLSWKHYLVVAVLAFTAYAPTLKVGFLWDDHVIIENNPWIREWSWTSLRHDFRSDNTQGQGDDYYRPLQAVSHRLDYSIWGLRPFGFHLTDLFFHIAAGLLLMHLLIALGFSSLAALLTSSLFVVHPSGIEQFLVASGRTTPLSFCFTLICLIALLLETPAGTILGLFAYAGALLTKEIGIIAPFLVTCVFHFRNKPLRSYRVIIPMALITVGYLALRHRAVQIQGHFSAPLAWLFVSHVFPRILTHYVLLLLWPWNLHSHRMITHMSHFWSVSLGGWIALTAWLAWKKNKTGLFCIAWMVINLLPTIPVMINGGFMLDHWAYQASLSVLLPLGLLFERLWEGRGGRSSYFMALSYFPLLIFWALLVHLNVALRGTDEKMYRWALHFTTSSPIKYNLGLVLLQSGRAAEAIPYFEDVRALYPENSMNNHALELAHLQTSRLETTDRKRDRRDPAIQTPHE